MSYGITAERWGGGFVAIRVAECSGGLDMAHKPDDRAHSDAAASVAWSKRRSGKPVAIEFADEFHAAVVAA